MTPSDSGRPPDEHDGGYADEGSRPADADERPLGDDEARLREEEAEARLREIGSFTDSMAAFAGPDDEAPASRGNDYRRRRRDEHEHGHGPSHDAAYDHDYDEGGTSLVRWAIRVLVPLVFLGGVVALVLVVVNSGILGGGEAAVSPSPTASQSGPAVVGERAYKVKKGDTLSQIADRFGVSVDRILEANPKINISNLSVGTKIKIPAPL